MEAAQTLERCYTQLGNVYDHESCPIRSTVEIDSSEGFYRITLTVTATTYRLTAIPVSEGPQDKDTECTEFPLTNTGVKTATGSLGDRC